MTGCNECGDLIEDGDECYCKDCWKGQEEATKMAVEEGEESRKRGDDCEYDLKVIEKELSEKNDKISELEDTIEELRQEIRELGG